jgi:hypothetical protein
MAKLGANRRKGTGVSLAICIVAALLGFGIGKNSTTAGRVSPHQSVKRSDEKTIERYQRPGEPFLFGNLAVKKTRIGLREKFNINSLAERVGQPVEDWLENLQFAIKNRTNKEMTFILLELQFPETEVNGPMMVYHLTIGMPKKATENELRTHKALALKPNNSIVFTLSENDLKGLKNFLSLRGFQLDGLNNVVIRIMSIYFEDGMKWEQDYYYRPNPNSPGGFERIDQTMQ